MQFWKAKSRGFAKALEAERKGRDERNKKAHAVLRRMMAEEDRSKCKVKKISLMLDKAEIGGKFDQIEGETQIEGAF